MKLTTLQWNIGGGKIAAPDSDRSLDASYTTENIHYVISVIKLYQPDIITLNETHTDPRNPEINQAKMIADALGYGYSCNDAIENSHITLGQRIGQSIISRWPLTDHRFTLFYNPRYETTGWDGSHWISHDKGVTSAIVNLPNTGVLHVQTTHVVPFHRFDIALTDPSVPKVLADVAHKVTPQKATSILQGDFNLDVASLAGLLPTLIGVSYQEVVQHEPTIPRGKIIDHVLYVGLTHLKTIVDTTVLADHYPVYSEFELEV